MLRVLDCVIDGWGGRFSGILFVLLVHLAVGIVEDPGCLGEIDQADVFLDELGDQGPYIVHLGQRLE